MRIDKVDKRHGFLFLSKMMELLKHIFPMKKHTFILAKQGVKRDCVNPNRLSVRHLAKKDRF
jgi:hypothetical protein